MKLGLGAGIWSGNGSKVYNPDALLYFSTANITNSTEKIAVNNWFIATSSLRSGSKIIAAYLISPTSFSSSLYCAIRRTAATFTVGNSPNWSATDGWDFNGVNQFLKTGLNASIDVPVNNGGIAAWSLDDVTSAGTFIGCNSGASDRFLLNPENTSNQTRFGAYDSAGTLGGTAGASNEFYAGYVTGASARKLYRAQVEIGTSSSAVAGTRPNLEIYMGCSNTSGSAANYSLRRMAAAFITKGLTPTEHNTLEAATRTYLTAIGRI